jgi:hypothetical protein
MVDFKPAVGDPNADEDDEKQAAKTNYVKVQ